MKKLAIIVGHNSEKQGAVRIDTGESEYRWNTRLARMIEEKASNFSVRIFYRLPGLGYSKEIREVYNAVNAWEADASIELHFNSVDDPRVNGTEVLASTTQQSLRFGGYVQEALVGELGFRDRGVRSRARSDRGGKSLYSGKCPAILIEPFFGSCKTGLDTIDSEEGMEGLAGVIVESCGKFLLAQPRVDLKGSRTLKSVKGQRGAGVMGVVSVAGVGVMELASGVLGPATTPLGAIDAVLQWQKYVPLSTFFFVVIALIAFYLTRRGSSLIEDARRNDHLNERR